MKTIPLTKGQIAIVDDEDYEMLMKRKWCAVASGSSNFYAMGTINGEAVLMHRVIMGVTEKSQFVDHKNHNSLDNRKGNMRICSSSENTKNKRSKKGSSSKYLGVTKVAGNKRQGPPKRDTWRAMIAHEGRRMAIGSFHDEEEAARAYDEAAKKFHGEFANLNFKPEPNRQLTLDGY
jgi:hypothetical protein